jgi:hypothetical protein
VEAPPIAATERSTDDFPKGKPLETVAMSTDKPSTESSQIPDVLLQILARLTSLEERDSKILETYTKLSKRNSGDNSSPISEHRLEDSMGSQSDISSSCAPSMKVLYGSTSLNVSDP